MEQNEQFSKLVETVTPQFQEVMDEVRRLSSQFITDWTAGRYASALSGAYALSQHVSGLPPFMHHILHQRYCDEDHGANPFAGLVEGGGYL